MKIRHALTGLAAAGLVFAGAGGAVAQVHPDTGSTSCTNSNYFYQYTRYHGTICYTNPGDDDLSGSAFWTDEIRTGANTGWIKVRLTTGEEKTISYSAGRVMNFADTDTWHFPGGTVALLWLHIS